MEEIAAHVRASKALVSAFRGSSGFVHVSFSEREELQALFADTQLTVDQTTELISIVTGIGLERDDELELFKVLQRQLVSGRAKPTIGSVGPPVAATAPAGLVGPPPPAQMSAPTGHGEMQNFESIVNFFPAEV